MPRIAPSGINLTIMRLAEAAKSLCRRVHRERQRTLAFLPHHWRERTRTTDPASLRRQERYLLHSFAKGSASYLRGVPSIHVDSRATNFNPKHQHCQARLLSTWLPEAVHGFSVWGGSGFVLKTLHADGVLPYWACFAAISIIVRTCLFPVVVYGARTSSRFAKVIPEVQFLLTLYQNDAKKLRQDKASWAEHLVLFRVNLTTLRGLYKLHKVHPLAIFLSPLMQLPIFWYISIDLRKIVNGLDPLLAQQLVDSSIAWVSDLTEPDPWVGLPIFAGLALYANVEVATGRHTLSGPIAAKSDTGVQLKDLFQSLAVFMPCFTAQLPSGVQIYIATSFLFTAFQSVALRTESIRAQLGLPSLLAPPTGPVYGQQFLRLSKLEQEAEELRGPDGPVLGKGVLAPGWRVSFAGRHIDSTIKGNGNTPPVQPIPLPTSGSNPGTKKRPTSFQVTLPPLPHVQGVSAPLWQLEEQQRLAQKESLNEDQREYLPQYSDDVIERANRGELPRPLKRTSTRRISTKLSLKRFQKRSNRRRPKR